MSHELGDNFKVYVRASGRDAFEAAMSLAFNGKTAQYWAETKTWGLCYFWFVEKQEGMRVEHSHSELDRQTYTWHSKGLNGVTLYSADSSECYWTEKYKINKLTNPVGVGMLLDDAWDWLQDPTTVYPEEPDHDGFNDRGFTVATQEGLWEGHIGSHHGGICFIRPDWMWIGK